MNPLHTDVTTSHANPTLATASATACMAEPASLSLKSSPVAASPNSHDQTMQLSGRQTESAKPCPPPSPCAVSNGETSASGQSSEERQSKEPCGTEGYASLSLSQAEVERGRNDEHRKMLRGLATCPYCRGLFEGMTGLQNHLGTFDMCRRLSRKDNDEHRCDVCEAAVFVGAVGLTAHKMQEHYHPGVAVQCPYCWQAQLGLGGLTNHLNYRKNCQKYWASDKEEYRCEGCDHQCVSAAAMLHHREECPARPAGMPLLLDPQDVSAFCSFQPDYVWCPCCDGRFGDMPFLRQHFEISAQCGAADSNDPKCLTCKRCGANGLNKALLWAHLCQWPHCRWQYGGPEAALSAVRVAEKE